MLHSCFQGLCLDKLPLVDKVTEISTHFVMSRLKSIETLCPLGKLVMMFEDQTLGCTV